jgi:hemoglobin/transferrin/lactoferrin receptor protein
MNTTHTIIATAIALILASPTNAATELKKTQVASENSAKVSTKDKVITSADIDKEMNGGISDSTRYISGVDVSGTGNRFGDNGFNIRGMEGDSVAITVDGLVQGESLDPPNFSRYGMFSSTRNSIEPESVKTIRIVKGASSVTAGSGALGGAVMYTTKDADDFLDNSVDAFGGSVKMGYDGRSNEKLASVALAKRFNDVEALAIFTSREGNEVKSHSEGADIKGHERGQSDPLNKSQKNVLIKLAYHVSDNKTIGLVFEDYSKETTGQSLSRESSSYSNFTFDDASNRERIGVSFDWQADNSLFDELNAKIDQQKIFTSGITAFDYTSRGSSYLRTEDRNYNQEISNVSIDLIKLVNVSNLVHDINYGVALASATVKNSLQDIRFNGLTPDTGLKKDYPIIDPSWVPETETKTTSFYARDAVKVTDKLTLSAGARYDKTSYTPQVDDSFTDSNGNAVLASDFSAVSTQLSASYQIAPSHHIFASIGTGFKAPTTQQLYLNTNGTSQFIDVVRAVDSVTGAVSYNPTGLTAVDLDSVTNPDLEAEEALNVEISYTWSTDDATIALTAFNSKYDNRIVNQLQSNTFGTAITQATSSHFNPACNVPVRGDDCYEVSTVTGDDWTMSVNSGEVTVSGFEVEASWHISTQLDLRFSYSHAQGQYDKTIAAGNKKGDKLESVAPDSAFLGFDYLGDSAQWGLSAITRYIAKKDKEESYDTAFYTDSATIVDLTAFYKVTDDVTVRGGIYNAFDENYSQWQSVGRVREGNGGFFGGVKGDGIERFSQTGREFVVNVNYSF